MSLFVSALYIQALILADKDYKKKNKQNNTRTRTYYYLTKSFRAPLNSNLRNSKLQKTRKDFHQLGFQLNDLIKQALTKVHILFTSYLFYFPYESKEQTLLSRNVKFQSGI